MIIRTTYKAIMGILILLCIFFLILGVYSLDSSLISISGLFVIAIILLRLEMKDHLINPFD